MSTLLLDQGNTRWKMATVQGLARGEVVAGDNNDLEAFRNALARMGGDCAQVLVSSVAATGIRSRFVDILESSTGCRARRVCSTDTLPGVQAGYRDNAQLGVDRLLAMVAARAEVRGPCCVVDAGTAITVDFVDADGDHLGGFILPGLRSFRDTLLANTAIPRDAQVEEGAEFGRDTATAVDLGARFAVAGLVALVFARRPAQFGEFPPTVCIGGGDTGRLFDLMPSPCLKIPNLVLQGLAVVAAVEGR
ncbi:MAG: type III pantothenate kinase [Gammaproteobacteria bacterium]|nr:type III pantothenate kinase [Gammaproteobacteria bacterium]